ncbi:transcription antitermination factor NusB [Spongiibacter sp. KMU-158]|uniref:Transcription antitermination protein NusB n=1 Tax=Spongiibacter pelagi TaxID=2760804 RepID=A0A927C1F9_9GAMM|nr:transcription antitermination factor NusB [Spongiibacter pelagi]MBD2857755.1 transcription antitermination factor NusB [Spongiibacter pelagi]
MAKPSNSEQQARNQLTASRRKARHYAMQALYQWQMAGQALSEIEAQFRVDYDMAHVDLAFFSELLHEIPAQLTEVQEVFEAHLDRKLDDLDPIELTLLRMGTFELMSRLDVPYKVVINETVNLAKRFGATESFRYINGILDKVAASTRELEVSAEKGSGKS